MADEPKKAEQKTLEMRVAELEDRLAKVHITEDELKAYQKVASLVGGQAAPASPYTATFYLYHFLHCEPVRHLTVHYPAVHYPAVYYPPMHYSAMHYSTVHF